MPTQSPQFNATLVARHDLHEGLAVVHIRPDTGQVPSFKPGQYVTIGLPGVPGEPLIRRVYSIASDPNTHDALELYINVVSGGHLTPLLWTLHVGDRLYVNPAIHGKFTLDEVPTDQNLVMVATGTGISPYMAMLRHFKGTGRWRTFTVIHGVRQVNDLGYRDELEDAAKNDPSIFYVPTVTRESWPGLAVRPTEILFGDVYEKIVGVKLLPENCHVFLCGNPAMVDDVESQLLARGFHKNKKQLPGNIHEEAYWRQ